jgi:hypothetical protein
MNHSDPLYGCVYVCLHQSDDGGVPFKMYSFLSFFIFWKISASVVAKNSKNKKGTAPSLIIVDQSF